MKLRGQMDDQFDQYFARAALEHVAQEQNRRGSLPVPHIRESPSPESHHRRVASCRIPRKKGVASLNSSPQRSETPSRKPSPNKDRRGSAAELRPPRPPAELTLKAPPTEFKTSSAPHSRSSSWRKSRRPRAKREAIKEARARASSVPTEELLYRKLQQLRLLQSEDRYVVRNFETSSKGIVAKGDLIKTKSSNSLASEASSIAGDDLEVPLTLEAQTPGSGAGSVASSSAPSVFRVLITGDHGVGKSAIVQQFMTSEYMGAIDSSFDEWGEKTVSVLLDGEETVMDIIEIQSDQDYRTYGEVDAYVLVYSVTDRKSFYHMVDILNELNQDESSYSAVILVGNKRDLARARVVSEEEAKKISLDLNGKCTEISASLNLKVDELLVGIARQIRLKPKRAERRLKRTGSSKCLQKGKFFFEKLLPRTLMSKSCDNLLVL